MNANQEIIAELRRVLGERDDARSTIEDLNDEIARGREAIRIYRTETEAAKRERDEALERLENEIKAANQARMAEKRARESLDELDEAIYDCLPSDYDDDSPLDCVERAADRLRDLAQERDEARAEVAGLIDALDDMRHQRDRYHVELKQERAEVERLRAEADSSLAMAKIADEKHDMKCAEVEMLRGVGCMEDGDGPCGVCRKCAYRRGAEAMREVAMGAAWHSSAMTLHKRIKDLPIPEEP